MCMGPGARCAGGAGGLPGRFSHRGPGRERRALGGGGQGKWTYPRVGKSNIRKARFGKKYKKGIGNKNAR